MFRCFVTFVLIFPANSIEPRKDASFVKGHSVVNTSIVSLNIFIIIGNLYRLSVLS